MKFVTLKAYEKAGGALRRDLFAQGEDGVFIQDIVLLESLAAKKLEKTAATLRKEGWKWVEIRSGFDYSEWTKCQRRYPEPEALPEGQQAELDALTEELRQLETDEPAEDGEENPRVAEIGQPIGDLEDREDLWPPETLAIAGAVVSIDRQGKAEIHAAM